MSVDRLLAEQLRKIDDVNREGTFAANWNSLRQYSIPSWYEDAKFGIFIHWGPYSVPAFESEWYARQMYQEGSRAFQHHVATYGTQNKFGYKDFIPMFKAEKFDADEWVSLFKQSGAKFFVPVAEHHDGFPMYDCPFTDWNAARMGPKRDVIRELADAARRQHLVFGVSSHHAENWWFYNGGAAFDSDVLDPRNAGLYGPAQPCHPNNWVPATQPNEPFLEDWLARTSDLIVRYEPQLLWFDWWISQPAFKPYLQRLAAYYYNIGRERNRGVAINYKDDAFAEGTAVFDIERGQLSDIRPLFWQTDTSVSQNSWSYISDHKYKTADSIIGDLIDIVSKNGAMLLNIGPRADGTIPEEEQAILRQIGQWLAINGEAIYSTRPWKVFGEGPTRVGSGSFSDTARSAFTSRDIRFTVKNDRLYAIVLAMPEDGKVVIRSLSNCLYLHPEQIESVELLGHPRGLDWSRGEDGLTIQLPPEFSAQGAFTFRMIRFGS
ncbi:alpha-L-fucosidase [Paenibacillus sp. PAMC21692]|uniref:alpha-L-fucosidase n=1 Tax=Paenibacillus sp. PAMC21692 TaxID=2762320 RepID=UPI00164CF6D9|nr:alpha-L-fucosidase [Paenibacillus sp. PAMC21692]QNK55024.1 alpha-L-fucosidase [Paenibacillus sp. PAMC21692]